MLLTEGRRAMTNLAHLIILEPTDACNLRCGYCQRAASYLNKSSRPTLLPLECATALLKDVLETTESHNIEVIFEGAEPTIAPIPWYENLFSAVDTLAIINNKRIVWKLQTNGQCIDLEWVALFRAYGVKVGISIDGPAEVAEPMRQGTQKAMDAIALLQENDLPVGVVVVGTSRNLPYIGEIQDFLAWLIHQKQES
jgi:uncharacterized protein